MSYRALLYSSGGEHLGNLLVRHAQDLTHDHLVVLAQKGLWGAKITSVSEMLPERRAERKSDRQVINAGPALGCNAPTLPRTRSRHHPFQTRMTFWHPTVKNCAIEALNGTRACGSAVISRYDANTG